MGTSGGGVFLPSDPPPSTGQVLTTPTITSPTVTGGTFTTPTLTSPTISGSAGSMTWQSVAATSTGATGTNATSITIGSPGLITVTGASGAGVAFPTGSVVPGAIYFLKNLGTGATNVYSVGATINGTTGTTAYTITTTGTQGGAFMCVTAGAWQVIPLIT